MDKLGKSWGNPGNKTADEQQNNRQRADCPSCLIHGCVLRIRRFLTAALPCHACVKKLLKEDKT